MHFHLAHNPWIQAIDCRGRPVSLSLREAFEKSSEIVSLAGPDTVVVAVTRMLVAIARDALPSDPITDEQWNTWWRNGCLPDITGYFDTYADRFDLFGSAPIFQDVSMAGDGTGIKSVSELTPHVPSGANPVLWDHHTDLSGSDPLLLSPAAAAGWLVSTQAFLRTGVFGSKGGAGNGRANGRQGLLLGRAVCIPVGPTLAHTLLLSLRTPALRAARPVGDVPPWRRDRAVIQGPPAGPVQLLTWQIRHILLLPEPDGTVKRCKIAADNEVDPRVDTGPQQRFDPHLAFTPNTRWDPTKPEIIPGKPPKANRQYLAAPYNPDRAAWRQAPALLGTRSSAGAVAALAALPTHEVDVPVGVEVFGLAVESTAKYVDQMRSRLPGSLGEHAVQVLADVAEACEQAASGLAAAGVILHKGVKLLPERPDLAATIRVGAIFTRDFWPRLEPYALDLLDQIRTSPTDSSREALAEGWRGRVKETARGVMTRAGDQYPLTATAMQARSDAARYLNSVLKKIGTTDAHDPAEAEGDDAPIQEETSPA